MEIKKTYVDLNPELLHDQIKDFLLKHGAALEKSQLQTYSLPGASTHTVRSSLTFRSGKADKESIRVNIVGTTIGETKVLFDIDETLFPEADVQAVQRDIDFVFGSYEKKPAG